MDKEKVNQYTGLLSNKLSKLWEELEDDIKLATEVIELRMKIEYLEAKQSRLFKEYGEKVFIYKECTGPHVDQLLEEIRLIEQQLQKKYLQIEKIKAEH